ncbi:non-ribosomal peptide synthase/polyketide synthase [Cystobacter fuscus]|nr:non-ribosomal peptide synthase/polyketide synthase [Cystobacter fuscus]
MTVSSRPSPVSLIDVLQQAALEKGERPLLTFLGESEGEDELLGGGELDRRARRIAAALQAMGAQGERVLLLYPPGLEYIAGFFGCLYAGAIAVPAYPPDPMRLERTLPRLRAIVQDAQATVVLTTSGILSLSELFFEQAPDFKELRWMASDELPAGTEDSWRRPEVATRTLAFLQYTSGSTGTPKGVMLTHGNLLHNLELISHAFQVRPGSSGVIWLPPYHDMGLIGGILQPIYGAFPVTLMSPLTFLKQPFRWLEAISRFEATISGGPNFAYDLCVRKISPEQRRSLDLSSWELAFSGAEPIRPETLDRFTEAFGPCGFRRESFYPCYGLAEATLIVSGGNPAEVPILNTVDAKALERNRADAARPGEVGARTLVGCGQRLLDQELAVVHPETLTRCPPGTVGEIWVRGASVAQGYWRKPEETERAFGARLVGGEGPFLRTGDLGFLSGAELFVTGRSKDLIIIRGRNHYPQDIELTVERSHPALRPGCGAAFAIEVDGEEQLVVVQEIDPRQQPSAPDEIVEIVRKRVAEEHDAPLHGLVLLEPGSIPKTSSGKIQRHACRAGFRDGTLRQVLSWTRTESPGPAADAPVRVLTADASTEELQGWLTEQVAARLRVRPESLDPAEPLTRQGLDSLASAELAHEIERELGLAMPMSALLEAPSLAELARQLSNLRAAGSRERPHALIPTSLEQPAPLSFAQQRLWFLEQLAPGSPFYNIPAALRMQGPLDEQALTQGLEELTRRHGALRTCIEVGGDGPVQRVLPERPLPLARVDLTALPATAREAELLRRAGEEARRPFTLSQGPLLRVSLFRLDEREHLLLMVVHHIIADGWSMGVLVRELAALYEAMLAGRPSPLPEPTLQYVDYARWQRDARWSEGLGEHLAYWRRQLDGAPRVLALPTDRPRPAVETHGGASIPVRLSRALSEALLALGRREGVTPFMLLLAGFQAVLSRWSGQEDVSVGTPVAGRGRAGLEGLVGIFVNTLVLRTSLSGDPSFRELLGRVREATLGAYAHQDVPFERLVEELRPERDLAHSPLFQVMLAFQQDPLSELQMQGLSLRTLDVETGTAKFELTLSLAETAEGFGGTLEYNTDLFDAGTAARLVEHLGTLLEAAVAAPERRLSTLPLLTADERQRLLVDWNDTRRQVSPAASIHQLFEAQAARTPEAVAVVSGDEHLTYRELQQRARQLAWHLKELGVGPESVVGLYAPRSLELVVGLLGILGAGGAYLPLDPAYPRERLGYVLEDSGARVVVTQGRVAGTLPAVGVRTVLLESVPVGTGSRPPHPAVGPETLAYALYTSGSTGRPKGVLIEQRSVLNFFEAMDERLGSAPGVWLAVTSISFDISVLELLWTLTRGFQVVLQDEVLDVPALAARLREQHATHLQCTPSLARALALVPEAAAALKGLRMMLVGGEALPVPLARQLHQLVPGGLLNMYGPTETTVWSTTHRVRESEEGTVSIGTPVANTRLYILDRHQQPVPVGIAGELYIAGDGVARGYLARPELTAERFVPEPLGGEPGARMYRTGDLARWKADGTVEFIGRADNQVKVRGFRIELGEVEAALALHPSVREVVVAARQDSSGSAWLVAYVVARSGQELGTAELRAFARQRLPEAMVPSVFMTLEALPLTPNGKVDRKALPVPGAHAEEKAFIAPRPGTQETLAALWRELLGLERVGAGDDFFELGGHSLLATQLASRLRGAFQVELPLRVLFEASNLAAQAERIDAAPRSALARPLVPQPRTGKLPLSFAQQRLWFLEQLEPGGSVYTLAGAVRLEGTLEVEALERALGALVERHEALRTVFQSEGGEPHQVIRAAGAFTLPRVELGALAEHEREGAVRRLAEEEAQRPFNLAAGPLLRATLLRLSGTRHVLLVAMHHIISDGWSMGVLVREVAALYAGFVSGSAPRLPPLPVQYADYSLWQREWLRGEVLQVQLEYWKQQLAGAPQLLNLPTDRPRPAIQSLRGAMLPVRLSRTLSDALKSFGQKHGATPFMVLMAAFQALLHRYSGQDDLCVGTPIAGRNRSEIEGLIGFFVNTLVLRARISTGSSFLDLLQEVRDVTLGAYAHQDIPFEKLVEELRPVRSRGHSPLFQVMLELHEDFQAEQSLPGLTLRPLEVERHTAKFDLSFSLTETAEGFGGTLEYNTDLFDTGTAARLVEHLGTLLEAAVAAPEQRLSTLPLLTTAERQRLLVDWNDTRRQVSPAASIHQLFEAQAARTPEAIAVVSGDEHLTYRELQQRARQLAWHLKELGVGPESVVGLYAQRSLELVVGLLGILGAGGAYLPLDPAYPRERLGYVLEDSGARVVVTQGRVAGTLPAMNVRTVLLESVLESVPVGAEPRPPHPAVGPETLAYALYTSGSTGRPKGVLIEQRNVLNFFEAMDERLGSTPGVWLAVTSISFDISVLELLWTLTRGFQVVLQDEMLDVLALAARLREQRATHLQCTPSLARVLALVPEAAEALKGLRMMLVGGEALPVPLARQLHQLVPGGLLNMYGPTETTVWSTTHRVRETEEGTVSIGTPVANTRLYLLDKYLQPVPVGVPGELYIAGDGVARGYLARPELTAERFVPEPLGGEPGARMYRTGDLARWKADGTVEFIGRADNQVKVRGFRIELGEVEAALALHPSVREVVVAARQDSSGSAWLVAYVVARSGQELGTTELRAFARQRLPEAMVPSVFMTLEALPLTPNGKVDRKALPVPGAHAEEKAFIAPRPGTQETLAALWRELLGLERVGAGDDFFELGGHSLLATQLASRLRGAFQVELPLRVLFEASILAAQAERIDAAPRSAVARPLVPQPRTGKLPLSFAQQRLWFLEQLEPGGSVYTLAGAVRLEGALEVEALERALGALVERHEALRTVFQSEGGEPHQVIRAAGAFALPRVELGALAEHEREGAVRRLAEEEAQRPFNLAAGPMLRATLLRLSGTRHVLLVAMHHIISDGWSMGVLVREVAALYAGFVSGSAPRLPPLPVQYADYSLWQREWLRGEVLAQQVDWWKQQLLGAPHALELPTDFPRPPVLSTRGATVPVRLSRELSNALERLAQREGATPFMLLLAAFQLLLSRYSGQDDVLVGSPIAGRRHAETEGLIGFFVNTLVLRARMDGQHTFRQFLARVRESTLGAFEHQDVPFEKLVEELQPRRDLSRSPLFQAFFALQNEPVRALALDTLSLHPLAQPDATTVKFELSLMLDESPDGFLGTLRYSAELFSPATASRMARHFEVLLEAITSQPDLRLSALPLLTPEEQRLLLRAWNDTGAEAVPDSCFHLAFEQRAALVPDAPAVRFEDSVLSFSELNARANQLAWHLRSLGVGPDVRVALCFERSVDMVVALLGVMKAGGAYVPLDPAWPVQRQSFTIQDCAATVLLTHRRLVSSWSLAGTHVLYLDDAAGALSTMPTRDLAPAASPDHLAYVIYTSGSTGTPKGVMVQHRSVLNLHRALRRSVYAGLRAGSRVTVNAPLAFDGSVKQLVQLLDGHCLCIVPDAIRQDPEAMVTWLRRYRVDAVDCTPSLLRLMLQAGLLEGPAAPSLLVPGGEALDEATWQTLAASEHTRTFNVYGPTECTVDATAFAVQPGTRPSLGGPLLNVRIYVLDSHLRPVPLGVPGELFISGAGLARGYLGRPDLTAERFVPNPFGSVPGARMYRTGDLVRLREGVLEYLGRTDHQVKVRGFRIELGEIETALRDHEAVRHAAVLVREDVPGNKYIVGYVVSSRPDGADARELQAHLRRQLPEYMVPSVIVFLEALPLTPNGKIDRRALPMPDEVGLANEYVAPRTPGEVSLARVWQEVLKVERVGVHDNFFELGGHSLLATQVVSRIRKTLGIELELRALFEAPTVEQLAARLEMTVAHAAPPPIVAEAASGGPVPASFAQERLWFLDQLGPGSAVYNIPAALRLEGKLEADALARSLWEVMSRHESLRTTFAQDGEGRVVSVLRQEPLGSLGREDLRGVADLQARVRAEVEREAKTPFDLKNGPLVRARLLEVSEQEHVLLFTMHHIVSDAWSLGVLVREVMELYEAFAQGRASPLEPLAIQYADYAVWQRRWLSGAELDRQVGYWKRHLEGAPAALELPTDKPRPPVQTFNGASLKRALGQELSAGIDALSQKLGATPFMTLLSAFSVLLGRYSNQREVVVGTPIANRTRAETEPLIGFFANTLALRTDLSGEPSFAQLVGRVKEATLGAYAHQDLPFEKVVEALNVPRDMSRSPVFQVMFTLQNASETDFALPELRVSPLHADSGTSKFDLMLYIAPTRAGYATHWEFNSDLFEPSFIESLASHFERFIEGVLVRSDTSVYAVPLLSREERRKIVGEWNATATDFRNLPVHALFEEAAHRFPEVLAAIFDEKSMTYAQLHRRSNQLARYLQKLGVTPHSLVGMCLERSLEVPIAVLGILKAGAAYVPLDPTYPAERLRFMAEDARAPVLVTQTSLRERVEGSDAHIICLDDCAEVWRESDADLPLQVDTSGLCYVLYTSGSTGRPKGAALTHETLTNLVQWQLTESKLGPGDRTLQFSPLSFDVSFDEMLSTWAAGGTLVLVSEETRRDPRRLVDVLVRDEVARIFIPFVALRGIAEAAGERASRTYLREVVCGGEQLQVTPEVVGLFRQLPGSLLHNQYGPTETHFVTGHRLEGDPTQWPKLPPIGKPLFNTQMYVLDGHLEPVPVGVRGDLYIAGVHLARCYWQRGDLTADRFLPNPFSEAPGARMYRTGDVARYLPDGSIEFLGRSDHQVKVRGFRIELAEVEAALMAIDSVGTATVVAREDRPGLKQLVGYVVPKPGVSLQISELREGLKQRLPEYMVPSAFAVLERMPLTPSGKIDRRALPMPDEAGLASEYVAPRTPGEVSLARVWQEVLKVERVGVHDNFFELGGHSLLATQVVSRIRKTLGIELELRALFEAPTVEQLATRLESEGAGSTVAPPIVAGAASGGPVPASFAQERLWFLDQLEPGGAAYNIPAALRLEGKLEADALARSLWEVMSRHESLRTTFAQDGEGRVVVVPHQEPLGGLVREDLRGVADPRARVRAEAEREAKTPFDLKNGPLVRARLLEVSEQEHVLLFTMHHIVSDAWSLGVLVREVMELYEAFAQGRPSPLEPLAIQYTDYAVWQRGWLSGAELDRQVGYWKRHLEGAPTALELPTDKPRPPVQTFNGASLKRALGQELSAGLDALSQKLGATPFMTLLSAFSVLLGRYSNQREVVVGTPIANRTRAETEPLIGFFVNTLALRTDLSGEPSFAQLVGRVKEATLGAYAHQDLPFEKVVEALNVPRDMSRSPVFQVMFTLQNAPLPAAHLPGLLVEPLPVEGGTAKFDLTLIVAEQPDGFHLTAEYCSALFDASTISRLLAHLHTLLEGAVAHPDVRLSELPLLVAEERQQILTGWNGARADYPRDACLHTFIEAQVERTPDAVALVFGDEHLTYRQLDARANQLAWHLRSWGVGPEVRVGLFLERSLEMVVALLATLKAGGAYVPLDPDHPAQRLTWMLEDARPGVLLAQERLLPRLPPHEARLLCLDTRWDEVAFQPRHAPPPLATADALAYVIFTSGSTGRPKGAMNAHRGVVNRLLWMQQTFDLRPGDIVLQKTPFSFDVSVWEFFWPLMTGARLVIARPRGHQEPAYLARLIAETGITTVHFVPSMLQVFLEEPSVEQCTSLRRMVISGEALPLELAERCQRRLPWAGLHNLYGPTEAAVDVTWYTCVPDEPRRSVPIGRPLANTQIRLLDAHLRPVPLGVPGELFIGGVQVGRGYFARPELTAERFIPDAFGDTPGARLYRTGDVARWLPDGNIEYLGRADFQVKVRGLRIELGEIEATLEQHPAVQQAVVVAREGATGDKRLVAYVVARGGPEAVEVGALRSRLHEKLPEYMVPSAFVVLEALPLTPSGKVDRKALPAPEPTSPVTNYVTPSTSTERSLVRIWQEVLKVEHVGMQDNFFDLGGHSLLAAQLMARIIRELGGRLSIKDLFEAPTPASLVARMDALPEPDSTTNPIELRSGPQRPLFLVHAVGGGVSPYMALARQLSDEQAVYAFQARGLDGAEGPLDTVEAMASQYIKEMREVQPEGPFRLGGWSMGGVVAFEMARQLVALGQRVDLLVLLDPSSPEAHAEARDQHWPLGEYLADLARSRGTPLPWTADEIRQLIAHEDREAIALQAARKEGLVPLELTTEQLNARVAVFEANRRALVTYRPSQRLASDLVLLRPENSGSAHPWADWIQGAVTIEPVPGDHYSMLRSAGPSLRRLLRAP